MIKKEENYISLKQAQHIIGVSRPTMLKYVHEGIIPAKKFPETPKGRWYINELDIPTFIRKHDK